MKRRDFLIRSAILGCSAAASPFMTPVALASAPWDARLVVIILRGAMDGLDMVRPYGDREYAALRGGLTGGSVGEADLDGFYALHPSLEPLRPLWKQGGLGFAHAVSTPYRDQRSHFDGQDLLEAGTVGLDGAARRDGWLNRLLQSVPGVTGETSFALGRDRMLLMRGDAPVSTWAPESDLNLSPQARLLLETVHHDDPLFAGAVSDAIHIAESLGLIDVPENVMDAQEMVMERAEASRKQAADGHTMLAEFAAARLKEEARIAAFSLNGWDTHKGQAKAIARSGTQLAEVIGLLHDRLGPDVWGKTVVLAMTEFGRTARVNGSAGTDHGTGSAMVMAGGALRGGQVWADWPGLGDSDLYARRDLMPTRDVRAHAAWTLRSLFGIDRTLLETSVFPGLDMGNDPNLIL
ncbi:DUF1501 domain-containing protein [Donghicola mangrovi]|uniref:DUF1501 domain-containing protein n=1 Tax=Donghicola mangrovi TaxID=2729614 RepID=A0A850QDB4_9RHOB|nr:DUF1501 domain-containing protein [Donghicola mangrovi]NVO24149.1 DUF1501 domain-containing protein [Donghicola mangrovi]